MDFLIRRSMTIACLTKKIFLFGDKMLREQLDIFSTQYELCNIKWNEINHFFVSIYSEIHQPCCCRVLLYTLFQSNLFWFFLIVCWLYHLEKNWNLVDFSTFFGTWGIINKQMTAYYFKYIYFIVNYHLQLHFRIPNTNQR